MRWFIYSSLTFIILILVIKILIIKRDLKNLTKSIDKILNTDTNMLLTCTSKDKDIIDFTNSLNRELKLLRKIKLEILNKKSELQSTITDISHDIRTPLTAIKGYLDLLSSEKRLNKKYLKTIETKIEEMEVLTNELFDYSLFLDSFDSDNLTAIVLNSSLESSLAGFYGVFKKKNITPNVKMCEEKVIRKLDKNMLARIFDNIISNSLKYSENGLAVTLANDGTITFSNKTTKLNKLTSAKLFNRFYTVENAKISGGVGLSISKQLVELLGGTISANYDDNLFTITVHFPN